MYYYNKPKTPLKKIHLTYNTVTQLSTHTHIHSQDISWPVKGHLISGPLYPRQTGWAGRLLHAFNLQFYMFY